MVRQMFGYPSTLSYIFRPWLQGTLLAVVVTIGAAGKARAATPTISNGTLAATCAFPDVICVGTSSCRCTATLVHPRLVLYAAHCGTATRFTMGERRNGPMLTASNSQVNPGWGKKPNPNDDVDLDWAFAVLTEPVTDIPVTPVAYGCELDQVVRVGQQVYQCGFGAPNNGVKYWKTNTIAALADGVVTTGKGGVACPGDSGGPLLVRLMDNSWRTIGITSTIVPDEILPQCGNPGTWNDYSRLRREMIEWVETASGIDITPCHDREGNWKPTAECGGFFAGDTGGVGTWANACQGTPVVAKSATCASGVPDAGARDATLAEAGATNDAATTMDASVLDTGNVGVGGSAGASGSNGGAGVTGTGGAGHVANDGGTPVDAPDVVDESGCTCRVPGTAHRHTNPPVAWGAGVVALVIALRRRKSMPDRSRSYRGLS